MNKPVCCAQVISPDNLDTASMTFDADRMVKTIGGPIHIAEDSLQLSIYIDHSLVEVFTEHGQTLTTRIYRAAPPTNADQRVHLFAFGGEAVADVAAHQMKSIWSKADDLPEPVKVYEN